MVEENFYTLHFVPLSIKFRIFGIYYNNIILHNEKKGAYIL